MENLALNDGRVLILRQARESDYDALNIYLDKLGHETTFTTQYPGRPPGNREKFERALKESLFLLAWDGDKIVGMISSYIHRPDHIWENKVCSFGIHMLEDYYHSGLSTRLMASLENWARENKMHRIEGTVRAKNRRAISLYLKWGFELEGLRRENACINGEWESEYYIGKLLD